MRRSTATTHQQPVGAGEQLRAAPAAPRVGVVADAAAATFGGEPSAASAAAKAPATAAAVRAVAVAGAAGLLEGDALTALGAARRGDVDSLTAAAGGRVEAAEPGAVACAARCGAVRRARAIEIAGHEKREHATDLPVPRHRAQRAARQDGDIAVLGHRDDLRAPGRKLAQQWCGQPQFRALLGADARELIAADVIGRDAEHPLHSGVDRQALHHQQHHQPT